MAPSAQPSEKPYQDAPSPSVDAEEIARFSALADTWWDENGPMKPLHQMNACRIGYIESITGGVKNKALLDIGCGGGLISEPMTRLGANVTAIDASEKNIKIASLHAAQSNLSIDYQAITAETLAATGRQFDIILALEIIEHVADVNSFLHALHTLLKPGGTLILSTLNRTTKSYIFAILGAEYVLRLLPRGTHQWKKFIRPSELAKALRNLNLNVTDSTGMVMHPLNRSWSLNPRDLDVNYLITATKPL